MKFFKAFNLLHRRTKSDIFVSGSTVTTTDLEPPSRRYSLPVSLFHSVTFQTFANFKHLNDRGSGGGASVAIPFFGLENELNARLIEANNCWAKEYANLQCQLQECLEELHTERCKVQNLQQKLEENNRIILDLRRSSRRFEGLLAMSNHAATVSPQNTISGGAGVLLNAAMPNFLNGSLAVNIRTMDEYSSALQMTLATRKQLRDQEKISLFWKRKALDCNEFKSAITPSVSTISSVHDPLPLDRQIALDALISRRGLDASSRGQMGWKEISSGSMILIPKLPTYQSADEVCSPIDIARPAMSSENSLSSRLEPLASESMKAEISSLFGSPDSVKYLIPRKRREPPSPMGKLTKFTFATLAPTKKTDLNVESFGNLHAVRHHLMNNSRKVLWLTVMLQKTFGVDKLLVDESNGTLDEIDIEDEPSNSMVSVLPAPTSVPLSSGPPTRTLCQTSNIPTRKGVVTSVGTYNEVTVNGPKQGSKDWTSRRSWQSYKVRPVTRRVKPVLDGNVPLKHAPGSHNSQGRDKENSFARAIPIFKRKTLSNSIQ